MKWIVVQQGANPSSDFFVRPALKAEELNLYDLQSEPDVQLTHDGASIVFVRYLTPQWRRWVEQNRDMLQRLVFFMDDDLLDLKAHAGLPLRYRWKLYRLAWRHQRWLRRMQAELWVSTPWLAEKYQHWNPDVMEPQSPYTECETQKTVFYHGSASHAEEIRWLVPVVEEVLKRDSTFSFELIGNKAVREMFSHLPRVHVLQPMKWTAYKALVSRPGRTVGLAPLLPDPFNKARSATKFLDITQAGAVGIYADDPVYHSTVQHGHNGLLLPMDQAAWAEAIIELGNDNEYRTQLFHRACENLGS